MHFSTANFILQELQNQQEKRTSSGNLVASATKTSSSTAVKDSARQSFLVQVSLNTTTNSSKSKNSQPNDEMRTKICSAVFKKLWQEISHHDEQQKEEDFFILSCSGARNFYSSLCSSNLSSSCPWPSSPGCCFVSRKTNLTSPNVDHQEKKPSYFGVIVHDVNCIKMSQQKQNKNENNNHSKNNPVFVKALCSISFTPFLFRYSPMLSKVKHIDQKLPCAIPRHILENIIEASKISSNNFFAVCDFAAENGIGDLLFLSNNKNRILMLESIQEESLSTLDCLILPSLQFVQILAVGYGPQSFPFVDAESRSVTSWKKNNNHNNCSSQQEVAAKVHLDKLRKFFSLDVAKMLHQQQDEPMNTIIPEWLIPSDPSKVEFWCSICYLSSSKRKNNNNNQQQQDQDQNKKIDHDEEEEEHRREREEHNNHDQICKFLVPSSMLIAFPDIKLGSHQLPPKLREIIQEEKMLEFLDLVFPVENSIISNKNDHNNIQLHILMNQDQDYNNFDVESIVNSDHVQFQKASSGVLKIQNDCLFNCFDDFCEEKEENLAKNLLITNNKTRKNAAPVVAVVEQQQEDDKLAGKRRQRKK